MVLITAVVPVVVLDLVQGTAVVRWLLVLNLATVAPGGDGCAKFAR